MLGRGHQADAQLAALEALEIVDCRFEAIPSVVEITDSEQQFLACCGQRDFPAISPKSSRTIAKIC
jgi:hypothetical protein